MVSYLDAPLLVPVASAGGDYLSAAAYRKTGRSTRAQLQMWLQDVIDSGIEGVIPGGIYDMEEETDSVGLAGGTARRMLYAINDSATPKRLVLRGHGAILRNHVSDDVLNNFGITFWIQGNFSEVIIEGITCENVHGRIAGDTMGVFMLRSAGGYEPGVVRIKDGVWRNHSRHFQIGACNSLFLTDNRIEMEKGRESGVRYDEARPCVGLWCSVDANGAARNIHVHRNVYDGLTNPASLATNTDKSAGDGFVFGIAKGWHVSDNTIKNFAYEGILIFPQRLTSGSATTYPTIVSGNILDCSIATGSFNPDGVTPRTGNWGIRVDEDDILVSENKLHSTTRGLTLYMPTWNMGVFRPAFVRNQINMHPSEGEYAIELVGMNTTDKAIEQPDVSGNIIKWDTAGSSVVSELYGAYLQNVKDVKFFKNEITQRVLGGTDSVVAVHLEGATGESGHNRIRTDIAYQRRNAVTWEILGGELNDSPVPIKSLGSTGSFKAKEQRIDWTPGATGWHRLLFGIGRAAGMLRIKGDYNNKYTDCLIWFTLDTYSITGHAIVSLGDVNVNGGVINQIRVSNDSGVGGYLDIHVADITSATPIRIELTMFELGTMHMLNPPTSGPTVGATSESTATIRQGFESTQGFYTGGSFIKSIAGKLGFNHPAPADPLHFAGLSGTIDSLTNDTGPLWYWRYNAAGTLSPRVGVIAGVNYGRVQSAASNPLQLFNTDAQGMEMRTVVTGLGKTPMFLFVHDGTDWEVLQVTAGANDTGDAGFRTLQVPNT